MGRRKGPYNADYRPGSMVRVVERAVLEEFQRDWRRHNPLHDEQLEFGGRTARVREVWFYHRGDELYHLEGLPGVWHEECLRSASDGSQA
jgi:hypothetical protein